MYVIQNHFLVHKYLMELKDSGTLPKYFSDANFVAKFITSGNIVSEEVCNLYNTHNVSGNKHVAVLQVRISDGNYSPDFTEVRIVDQDTQMTILILQQPYEQYIHGYGTLELHNVII